MGRQQSPEELSPNVRGYSSDHEAEVRFIQDVAACRYARTEIPLRKGLVTTVAGLITVIWGPGMTAAGQESLALPLIFSGLAILALGAYRMGQQGFLEKKDGPEDDSACYLDSGVLTPRLVDGEEVLGRAKATAPVRARVRLVMGGLQCMWGAMLSGLPLATIAGAGGQGYDVWVAGFTVVGALVMGRGVRDATQLRPVEGWVLTNRRLVGVIRPGVAKSYWLEDFSHKPVVVPRSEERATLGLDLRRLTAAGLLPLFSLCGVDDMPRQEAERWAGWISENRPLPSD